MIQVDPTVRVGTVVVKRPEGAALLNNDAVADTSRVSGLVSAVRSSASTTATVPEPGRAPFVRPQKSSSAAERLIRECADATDGTVEEVADLVIDDEIRFG